MYNTFIGIDIAKVSFATAINGNKKVKTYTNDSKGYEAFLKDHKDALSPSALLVLETTGGYEQAFLNFLIQNSFQANQILPLGQ